MYLQNEYGRLNWLDVSMGKMVKQTKTHLGRLDVMCQNPSNAVLCCGHSRGTVTMWTPNVEQPVVKMLCQTQPIRACAIDQSGNYLATSAVDSSLKIWDLRTYNCLHSYRLGVGASNLAFSQRGLLAVSLGNTVEVYMRQLILLKSIFTVPCVKGVSRYIQKDRRPTVSETQFETGDIKLRILSVRRCIRRGLRNRYMQHVGSGSR